jgi:uncharacterized protein (DUF2147 family)
MRKLIAIAILALLSSTSAQAKGHEIKFGGRTMHIDVPKNCKKISCIHVTEVEKSSGKSRKSSTSAAAPSAAPSAAQAVAAAPQASATAVESQPVPAAPVAQTNAVAKDEPRAEAQPDDRKAIARLSLPANAEEKPAAASNPVGLAEPNLEPAKPQPASPIGLWLTEKRESKIRIEACGTALCGFVDGKPSEKVLINMQPGKNNRWNGKIHDIRSGGTYMAHIALKGASSLRVEGCAFGGLFCGGETWTRAE